jgi:hypothetical protein
MEAIATALEPISAEIPDLQVYAYWNNNPTPPSLDVYPGDPSQTGAGYGAGQSQVFFTIRGRVATGDSLGQQQLLLRMMDPNDAASVEAAVQDIVTVVPEGVSGYREYLETGTPFLGCEWRVTTFL